MKPTPPAIRYLLDIFFQKSSKSQIAKPCFLNYFLSLIFFAINAKYSFLFPKFQLTDCDFCFNSSKIVNTSFLCFFEFLFFLLFFAVHNIFLKLHCNKFYFFIC
ncbi:MAG: hypothetical protein B6U87_01975 [Candidatus Aenigmarchaeota archaeon ex4484_52]|nr:MAG: hypothetical protein B6U87_01975 [Candidatus Aenigmarchaeota archaeon ex4484_52]